MDEKHTQQIMIVAIVGVVAVVALVVGLMPQMSGRAYLPTNTIGSNTEAAIIPSDGGGGGGGAYCGNGICEVGEYYENCAADCPNNNNMEYLDPTQCSYFYGYEQDTYIDQNGNIIPSPSITMDCNPLDGKQGFVAEVTRANCYAGDHFSVIGWAHYGDSEPLDDSLPTQKTITCEDKDTGGWYAPFSVSGYCCEIQGTQMSAGKADLITRVTIDPVTRKQIIS